MDDDVTVAEIDEHADEPATKADLATLRGEFRDGLTKLEQRLEKRIQLSEARAEETKQEIIRHFDVVAENIHRDVAGANADEISSLQDTDARQEERLTALERKLGVPL